MYSSKNCVPYITTLVWLFPKVISAIGARVWCTTEIDKKEHNKKEQLSNTEEEFNLLLRAILRDYKALNASDDMQQNFIQQSKRIIDLFKRKRN